MLFGFLPLETGGAEHALVELPVPAWAFGVIGFALLLSLLLVTLAIGKGRPHS